MPLFEPYTIKNLEIRNRFVRSATYDGIADKNGRVSKRQMSLYQELALGKVRLLDAPQHFFHQSLDLRFHFVERFRSPPGGEFLVFLFHIVSLDNALLSWGLETTTGGQN